jgi:hypothetical protein
MDLSNFLSSVELSKTRIRAEDEEAFRQNMFKVILCGYYVF